MKQIAYADIVTASNLIDFLTTSMKQQRRPQPSATLGRYCTRCPCLFSKTKSSSRILCYCYSINSPIKKSGFLLLKFGISPMTALPSSPGEPSNVRKPTECTLLFSLSIYLIEGADLLSKASLIPCPSPSPSQTSTPATLYSGFFPSALSANLRTIKSLNPYLAQRSVHRGLWCVR